MKKVLFLFLLLLDLYLQSSAQLLYDNRLFVLSIEYTPDQSGYIHYIDYTNGGQDVLIDSNLYRDFHIVGDKLLATGNGSRLYQVPPNGMPGLTFLSSEPNMNAVRGFLSPTWKIYLCIDAPHLRMSSFYGLLFTLDTSYVPWGFTDAGVYNNKFYILYPDELRIIDLTLPSTTVAILPTPKPFPFGGVNTWFITMKDYHGNEHIYIDIEYYTALERCSLLELDQLAFTFDTLFHYNTFSNYYRPFPATGRLYMMNYDTHYDPVADTVLFTSNPPYPLYIPVGYSDIMGDFLLHNPGNKKVYFCNATGIFSDSANLGYDARKFHYWYDVIGSTAEPATPGFPFTIVQDPGGWVITAKDEHLRMNSVKVYDISGRLITNLSEGLGGRQARVSNDGSPAIYLIVIDCNKGRFVQKITTIN